MEITTQHRCCFCHKLLAQSHNPRGRLEIKCPRCKRVAVFNNVDSGADVYIDAELPLTAQPWQIGAIVGPSGSRRSLLLSPFLSDTANPAMTPPDGRIAKMLISPYKIRWAHRSTSASDQMARMKK